MPAPVPHRVPLAALAVLGVFATLLSLPATAGAQEQLANTGVCRWERALSQAGDFPGAAEAGDRLGSALTVGDFDGDGDPDVAVGVPGENGERGLVNVFFGPCGTGRVQSFSQAGAVPGASEAGDEFGAALAAGDFDGDGRDDLAVGVPGEDIDGAADAGAIVVLRGGSNGLTTSGSVGISQKGPVPGSAERNDRFGAALAAGDTNGDGRDDLLVGVPGEGVGSAAEAGMAVLLRGSANGLSATGAMSLTQRGPMSGASEAGDRLGAAVALGDLDGDGDADAVLGAPGEKLGAANAAGSIHVLDGSANGLTFSGQQSIHQGTAGVGGAGENGDGFGSSLAMGRINGDARTDLVVGAPGEDVGARADAGAVWVFFGNSSGVAISNSRALNQASSGVAGAAESGDRFGASVAVADINGDGYGEVVVGIPGEDTDGRTDAGAVHVLYGTNGSMTAAGDRIISQDSPDVSGASEHGDGFGTAVAGHVGAVFAGAPAEAIGSNGQAGVVVPFTQPVDRFETLPKGASLPSGDTCAQRVRSAPEIRPENTPYNNRRGIGANDQYPRVDGDFTGTTDEIIQWAACKWGMDEDMARAQAAIESWWRMNPPGGNPSSNPADCPPEKRGGATCPTTIGMLQIHYPSYTSAFENANASESTAYNLDYAFAVWRACMEGEFDWLNLFQPGRTYNGDDAWGCVGFWYSGRWYHSNSMGHINNVKSWLNERIWEADRFQ